MKITKKIQKKLKGLTFCEIEVMSVKTELTTIPFVNCPKIFDDVLVENLQCFDGGSIEINGIKKKIIVAVMLEEV